MKNQHLPKVSVIIPTYNQARYLKDSIESVLNQTYQNIEIIVINDGSTDETPEILKNYSKKIRYVNKKNEGASTALNLGVCKSTGVLLAWLSSDDQFLPKKIEEQVNLLHSKPDISVVYTNFYIIDKNGHITREQKCPYYLNKEEFIFELFLGNFINGSSVLIKKECFKKVGLFDTNLKVHVDGDMWSRLLKHYTFGHVNKTLLKYRWHSENLSHNLKIMYKYRKPRLKKLFTLYTIEELTRPLINDKKNYKITVAEILAKKYLFSKSLKMYFQSLLKYPFNFNNYIYLIKLLRHFLSFLIYMIKLFTPLKIKNLFTK